MNNILYIRRAIVNERCRWKWRTTSTLHHPHTVARLFCIANVNGRMVYKNSWAILDISGRFFLQFLALFLLDFSFIQFPRPPSFHPMPFISFAPSRSVVFLCWFFAFPIIVSHLCHFYCWNSRWMLKMSVPTLPFHRNNKKIIVIIKHYCQHKHTAGLACNSNVKINSKCEIK